MERKNDQEEELRLEQERQKAVISLLVFPESFEHIMDELKERMNQPVLISILRDLLRDQKVKVIDPETDKSTFYHDSDRMNDFYYQATAKGLACLDE